MENRGDDEEVAAQSEEVLDAEIDQALETLGIFIAENVNSKDIGPGQG